MSKNRVHFQGFNGARMIAALAVVVHHVEQVKSLFPLPNRWTEHWVYSVGKQGVDFFFVLSGFLITYLLLTEQRDTGAISAKNFYTRRVLRIFPLYYLIFVLAFVVQPWLPVRAVGEQIGIAFVNANVAQMNLGYWAKFWLFLVMLPNVAAAMFNPVWCAAQAWSIGLEEQFYLVWPWAMKWFRRHCYALAGAMIALRYGMLHFLDWFDLRAGTPLWVQNLLASLEIECLAVGAAAAYFYFTRPDLVRRYCTPKYFQLAAVPALFYLLCVGQFVPVFGLVAVGYALILLNLAENRWRWVTLENPVFSYLGKISYGLYMYQFHAILIGLSVAQWAFKFYGGDIPMNLIIYVSTYASLFVIAAVSYRFFETPFLNLKTKFGQVSAVDIKVARK